MAEVSKSLKEANIRKLLALLAANAIIFYLLANAKLIGVMNWSSLAANWIFFASAGGGVAFVGILNGQISSDMKARLVFFRWRFAYPGCRAFSVHGLKNMSVDMAVLESRYGSLPIDPKGQNVLWYRIYRSVETLPAVAQASRHYLFARDYACLSLGMAVVLGIAACFVIRPIPTFSAYEALLLVQCALALNAANIAGKSLVAIVLAQSAAHQ